MPIPFIRSGFPDGHRQIQEISRSADIENKAADFLEAGGRYLVEILEGGSVAITAIIDTKDGCKAVSREICENGPALLDAVDNLVRESILHLPPCVFIRDPEVTRILS